MDHRGTNMKARTAIKRLLQGSREEMVLVIKVARKGGFATYLRLQEGELAGDLNRIAGEKEARKTPTHAAQQLGGLL